MTGQNLKNLLLKLHLWLGLATGAFLLIIALSGAVIAFEFEIDRALNPRLSYVTPESRQLSITDLVARLEHAYPSESVVGVSLPQQPEFSVSLGLASGRQAFVNQYTGEVLGLRDRSQAFARFLHVLHTQLVAGKPGEIAVGTLTAVSCLILLSGLILWWPRRILMVRPGTSRRRLNFDLHNVLGFYSLLVVLIMAVTGVMITFEATADPLVRRLNSSPLPTPPRSTVLATPPITPDAALEIANSTVPGAMSTFTNTPSQANGVYRVIMKFPEDRTPAGRTRVHIDQYSGAVLLVENTRTAELGTRILNLVRSAHTGDIFGAPTRAIYVVASLMLAGQVITGFIIWWRPRRTAARPRRVNQAA
jgi:uncharacterized iron-regulated membrane protein